MKLNKFNNEGYSDPTAYRALSNIVKEQHQIRSFRPLVYICSPYFGDTSKNVKDARKYCRCAFDRGCIPIAPHLFFPQFLDESDIRERQLSQFFGDVLMGKCAEIWVFGNNISSGMEAEISHAKRKKFRIRCFTENCQEVI